MILAVVLSHLSVADAAPTLRLAGSCPGLVTIEMSGLTPAGRYALVSADTVGASIVPAGSCVGTGLRLSGSNRALRATGTADAAGLAVRAPDLPAGVCGSVVQLLDLATCETSNVATVRPPLDTTPSDIQRGLVPEDSVVRVSGVVTGAAPLGFFLQSPSGGPYSGLWVYVGATGPVEGDVVEVTGRYIEYFDLTEIDAATDGWGHVQVTGSAPVPAPGVVPIGGLDESWEGVLVQVQNVEVSYADLGFGEFEIANPYDGSQTMVVDDLLHSWSGFGAPEGTRLASVTGPLHYTFGVYKLVPRSDADIVTQ